MTTKLQLDAQDRTARVLCAYLQGDRDTANQAFREALEEPGQEATLELLNRLTEAAAGLAIAAAHWDASQALRNVEAARLDLACLTPEEDDPDTPTR